MEDLQFDKIVVLASPVPRAGATTAASYLETFGFQLYNTDRFWNQAIGALFAFPDLVVSSEVYQTRVREPVWKDRSFAQISDDLLDHIFEQYGEDYLLRRALLRAKAEGATKVVVDKITNLSEVELAREVGATVAAIEREGMKTYPYSALKKPDVVIQNPAPPGADDQAYFDLFMREVLSSLNEPLELGVDIKTGADRLIL